MDLSTILVAVDFSDVSEAALDYAVAFAETVDARLIVLHCYELPVYGFPDGPLVAPMDVATRVKDGARTGLEAMVARHRDAVHIDTVLRQGVPWEEVAIVAEEMAADLIVIGTHARHGLARTLLGSVAEKILRTSSRPVLTVCPPHGKHKDQRTYRAPASSSMPESPVRK
jgi:nucleotide-binding universal stress UspA family protein